MMQKRAGMTGKIMAAVAGIVLALIPVASAGAETSAPIKLGQVPVGQSGSYFDLTMAAGESRQLQVQLLNDGVAAVDARSYAADIYSLINGGFGVRTAADTITGATRWIDLATESLSLLPGRATSRTFTVTVPAATAPGQYIAGLVLENVVPEAGVGGLAQVIRSAMAVSIRVPGTLVPNLTIGDVSHEVQGDHSVVSVEVSNTGNSRLKPAASFLIRDAAGATIAKRSFALDSFYSHTRSTVELALPTVLGGGKYSVDLALTDAAEHLSVRRTSLGFTVPGSSHSTVAAAGGWQLPYAFSISGLLAAVLALLVVVALRRRAAGAARFSVFNSPGSGF